MSDGREEREEREKRREQDEREDREDRINRELRDQWKPERTESRSSRGINAAPLGSASTAPSRTFPRGSCTPGSSRLPHSLLHIRKTSTQRSHATHTPSRTCR